MANSTSSRPDDTTPLLKKSFHIAPKIPSYTRLRYNFFLHGAQALLRGVFFVVHLLGLRTPLNYPNFIKAYPAHPTLQHRFFIPEQTSAIDSKTITQNDETPKYPLYIDIHGGGFALLAPAVDDRFNRPFCEKYGVAVISRDYYKSPKDRFPVATTALGDIIISI